MEPAETIYPFKNDAQEYARLALQGGVLRNAALRFLKEAGLKPGMQVLDLGCGAGDFSLMAAHLVGPVGRVVGVDCDEKVIRHARNKCAKLGLKACRFRVGELSSLLPEHRFDAVIGRFILSYLDSPDLILLRLARANGDGTLFAFQEWDLSRDPFALPSSPAFDQLNRTIIEALQNRGVRLTMGSDLPQVMRTCGFDCRECWYEVVCGWSDDHQLLSYLIHTLNSLAQSRGELVRAQEIANDIDRTFRPRGSAPHLLTLAPIGCTIAISNSGRDSAVIA
jgi:ubiquinone/menaquinone biosynthesis C-methylase UbiE